MCSVQGTEAQQRGLSCSPDHTWGDKDFPGTASNPTSPAFPAGSYKRETLAHSTSVRDARQGSLLEMSFSLNFTLTVNTTSSPVATSAKANDCGPSIGLAAGIPSLLATALLVALLLTLIQRRRSIDEPTEESERPCEISELYDNPKISENPRRSPTHEMDPRGDQEGHIYVRTVSGSEEPRPNTYRPPEEIERRRGLWWLVPRLSFE